MNLFFFFQLWEEKFETKISHTDRELHYFGNVESLRVCLN